MSFSCFDPRVDIIDAIGFLYDVDGDNINESCVSFFYPDGIKSGSTCYIALFTSDEARTGELPNLPFIELTLMGAPGRVHNVQGDVRFDEAYVDMNIYVCNSDEINLKTWVPVCKSEIIDRVMDNRNSVSDCTWVEAKDTGREIIEVYGKRVVFHYVISLYANRYQIG